MYKTFILYIVRHVHMKHPWRLTSDAILYKIIYFSFLTTDVELRAEKVHFR